MEGGRERYKEREIDGWLDGWMDEQHREVYVCEWINDTGRAEKGVWFEWRRSVLWFLHWKNMKNTGEPNSTDFSTRVYFNDAVYFIGVQ